MDNNHGPRTLKLDQMAVMGKLHKMKFIIICLLIFQESSRKTIKAKGQNTGLKGKTKNFYLSMCNSKDE